MSNPFALSDLSEPEPDFLVAAPRPGGYRAAHPTTTSFVIEVAQTSRARDLGLKAALYAAGGVPDYWVVDLARDAIVVHRDPEATTFRSVEVAPRPDPAAAAPPRRLRGRRASM